MVSVTRAMSGGHQRGGEKQIMKDLTGQGEDLDYYSM